MECFLVKNGGGSPLNFKVVGNPQPETARENTIWVDTDYINNYYFSATQPENMADHDVWFPVGTSSPVEFNILKKNVIQVYPISAKQYVSGALVNVTAKNYQNGAWHDWCKYLYDRGDQCTDITGGWSTFANSNGTITYGADRITIAVTKNTTSKSDTMCTTVNPVDLTNYSMLSVNILANTNSMGQGIFMGVGQTKGSGVASVCAKEIGENTLDISSLTGSYYIYFNCGWTNPFTSSFNEVTLWP